MTAPEQLLTYEIARRYREYDHAVRSKVCSSTPLIEALATAIRELELTAELTAGLLGIEKHITSTLPALRAVLQTARRNRP
jgi:hypothetical protein